MFSHLHPQPHPSAIFFDAAGTLLDVAEPVGQTYSRIAAQHGMRTATDTLEAACCDEWRQMPSPLHPEDRPAQDDDRSLWSELARRTFKRAGGGPTPHVLFEELYAHDGQPYENSLDIRACWCSRTSTADYQESSEDSASPKVPCHPLGLRPAAGGLPPYRRELARRRRGRKNSRHRVFPCSTTECLAELIGGKTCFK